jgi:hypothetical protein
MQRRFVLSAGALGLGTVIMPRRILAAAPGPRISGPFTYENLAIYLVHGASQPGPTPLTLGEAMAKGKAKVHETQDVNRLEVEILGESDVFLQSGDIVKGGKQDRVLTVSMMLKPGTGRVPIDAFCVEQGRWQQRGREDVRSFASAEAMAPSRETKLAIKTPAPVAATNGRMADTPERQQKVWQSVARTQDELSRTLGAPVAAKASRSSLQLALENEKLAEARTRYVRALQPLAEQEPDVVGYVFAVNGRINSGEVYAGNALFRKMWRKLLEASATEALGARGTGNGTPPTPADVAAFLASAEGGRASQRRMPADGEIVTRDSDGAVFAEAGSRAKGWFHRSYVAK